MNYGGKYREVYGHLSKQHEARYPRFTEVLNSRGSKVSVIVKSDEYGEDHVYGANLQPTLVRRYVWTDKSDQEKGDHDSPANTDHPTLALDNFAVLIGPGYPMPR